MDGSVPSLAGHLAQGTAALLAEAWTLRQRRFPPRLDLAAPGARRYDTGHYRNHRHSFLHVSVTGVACALGCEHCAGRLLAGMLPAPTPAELVRLGLEARERGTEGLLVSGGADATGRVPLMPFAAALAELKRAGLLVIVHCGLIDRPTALALARSGVDQVLLDVIGDRETCRQVCHLDRGPEDYRQTLVALREAGLRLAPHVVIGLHRGEVRGEYEALRHIAGVGVDRLVLVVFSPQAHTPLADASPPAPEEAARVMAVARLLNPDTPLALGCARPVGPHKATLERLAVDAGVNALAYPLDKTVDYAQERGLAVHFHERCCSLGEIPPPAGVHDV